MSHGATQTSRHTRFIGYSGTGCVGPVNCSGFVWDGVGGCDFAFGSNACCSRVFGRSTRRNTRGPATGGSAGAACAGGAAGGAAVCGGGASGGGACCCGG